MTIRKFFSIFIKNLKRGKIFTRNLITEEDLSLESIEELFKYFRILTVASGDDDGELKGYMYTKHVKNFIKFENYL